MHASSHTTSTDGMGMDTLTLHSSMASIHTRLSAVSLGDDAIHACHSLHAHRRLLVLAHAHLSLALRSLTQFTATHVSPIFIAASHQLSAMFTGLIEEIGRIIRVTLVKYEHQHFIHNTIIISTSSTRHRTHSSPSSSSSSRRCRLRASPRQLHHLLLTHSVAQLDEITIVASFFHSACLPFCLTHCHVCLTCVCVYACVCACVCRETGQTVLRISSSTVLAGVQIGDSIATNGVTHTHDAHEAHS